MEQTVEDGELPGVAMRAISARKVKEGDFLLVSSCLTGRNSVGFGLVEVYPVMKIEPTELDQEILQFFFNNGRILAVNKETTLVMLF